MGASTSHLDNKLVQREAVLRGAYVRERSFIDRMDAKTTVPHIMLELRSPGFIEI